MSRSRWRSWVVAAAMLFASSMDAHAQFLPPVNLGATSFVDGGPPAGSGIYLNQYLQYYDARRFKDASGDTLPFPGSKVDAWASLTQLIFLSDRKLCFGASPALDILLPVATIDTDFAAPGPFPRDNGGGLGDLLIGPALQFDPIMSDRGPLFVHRVEAQFILPTGEYSPDREINPGANFFSFNPYWAGTLFLGPEVTASYRMHYLWNAANDEPPISTGTSSIQAGEAFHMNFAASYEVLPKMLRLGINGYYLKQTTDTRFDDIPIPGTREQVFAIGPGLLFSRSPEQHLFFNLYFEDYAHNRPEGTRLTLRYTHKF